MTEIVELWKSTMKHKDYEHIAVWGGGKQIKISSRICAISERQVQNILSESDSKTVVSVQGHGPKTRLREDINLWIKILQKNLMKKSGEQWDATYRSPYSKNALYEMFVAGWYGQCLDEQIIVNHTLVQEARESKSPTRFLQNILLLCEYKKSKGISVYTPDPLV